MVILFGLALDDRDKKMILPVIDSMLAKAKLRIF